MTIKTSSPSILKLKAKLQIQEKVKNKEVNLIWSTMLDFENAANPDEAIRTEIAGWRKLASEIIHQNDAIIRTAKILNESGIGRKDSLHISCAIAADCDYFVTVDKGILKK